MRFFQSLGCLTPAAIVFYAVIGVLFLGQFGGQALNYLTSMGWQQVPGTIVSSEVVDAWDTTGDRYVGQVLYTYEVDGVTYEGSQLSLQGTVYVGSREDAERLLLPYPAGTAVMPYVDPANPERAVLDRTLPNAIWVFTGMGSALVLLSLGLGIRYFANRRQPT